MMMNKLSHNLMKYIKIWKPGFQDQEDFEMQIKNNALILKYPLLLNIT